MKKSVWLTAVLFLLVSLTAVAQAAAEPVFCGDLAAADCALLQDAQTNAAAQTSGAVTMDVDLTLRNLDDSMPGEQVISLDVDAIWNGDFSRFESMETEMLARMDDPTQLMAMMSEMLAEMSGTIQSCQLDHSRSVFRMMNFFEDFATRVLRWKCALSMALLISTCPTLPRQCPARRWIYLPAGSALTSRN